MNIFLDIVRIAGFRGINNLEMSLAHVTTLIGANNSGKTSVLKALQLALGDYVRHLTEEDFHIAADEKRVKEMLVDVRIVAVDNNGKRIQSFDDSWATEFGDIIKAEANGLQFVVIRARAFPDTIKGTFECKRFTLERWPDYSSWQTEKIKESPLTKRFESIPFISIDAQRDIHQELTEKSSFVGKVLASIEYKQSEINELEALIKDLNEAAISKSGELQSLKAHLGDLNESFRGTGEAEITPFPKKIRDLSKHFTVHFGDKSANSFSMEYHGMGTRSWASMLTVKAFIDLMAKKRVQEVMPFFPILAAEEPEAHLHPNAQKTIYHQLSQSGPIGQVIMSTHSPYIAAVADVLDIRSLRNAPAGIVVNKLKDSLSEEDKKIISRQIMNRSGEILFSRALILCEGITEEQIIPAMFKVYFNKAAFNYGISCVSVGGKNYAPFLRLACSLGIPTAIVSDNDGSTKREITAQLRRLTSGKSVLLGSDIFKISFVSSGNDFEAELLKCKLRDEIVNALILSETNGSSNPRYQNAKRKEISSLKDEDILSKMRDTKASYSGFFADVIAANPNNKNPDALIPAAIIEAFKAIKGWLTI